MASLEKAPGRQDLGWAFAAGDWKRSPDAAKWALESFLGTSAHCTSWQEVKEKCSRWAREENGDRALGGEGGSSPGGAGKRQMMAVLEPDS